MTKLNAYLLTGRTIEQGKAKEYGKTSDLYMEAVAVCFFDPSDMKFLRVNEGEAVRLKTEFGEVILRAAQSERGPHPGVVYVPYGPWANRVTDPKTHGVGMPSFKGVPVEVEPAPSERVRNIRELLTLSYGETVR